MRPVWLAVVICAAAAAAAAEPDPYAPRPDGSLIIETPPELRTYDEPAAQRRLADIARALPHLRDPRAQASARLERATLQAAKARRERIAWIEARIRQDALKGPARQALDPELTRLHHAGVHAADAAIAELTDLVCDPADRGRGVACRPPPALQGWPELDEALYRLALTLALQKRRAEAARVYRRILDETPRSRHRPVALVEVAEHAYEQTDFAAAEVRYRELLADRPPAAAYLRAYATYKLGWIHLDRERGKEAFASFAAVPGLAGADPRAKLLVKEARGDLVYAFAMYGAPADAFAALEGAAPGHGLALLERLGGQWFDEEKHEEAIAVYRDLLGRAPADPRRCHWQLELVHGVNIVSFGDEPAQAREAEALANAVADTRGQPAAARCGPEARDLVHDAAARLIADHDPAADRLFGAFARAFPDDPDLGALRLRRADAAVEQAEKETGARARVLWRRAAIRFDEALRLGVLPAADRKRAIEGRDRARRHGGTP